MALNFPQIRSLEERTSSAHRLYIAAFQELELRQHQAVCDRCRDPGLSAKAALEAARFAEESKERYRSQFRDLLNNLGYLPTGGPMLRRRVTCKPTTQLTPPD